MDHLKHYTALAQSLLIDNPGAHETLEEEINILIHKLKFIPTESRPTVLLQQFSMSHIAPDYLEELIFVAGGQLLSPEVSAEAVDQLIFIHESPAFISQLPQLLQEQYAGFQAVEKNQVYLIQKADFGMQASAYLEDIEILAEIVQSKYFVYGHEGRHWMKFDLA